MLRYAVNNHWIIAFRDKKRKDKYEIIKNPPWAWAADPFVVKFHDETYVFAELFLYKSERKGIIGFSRYIDGRFTDWIITMDKKWHLSYPNVFVHDDELYMCPESYQKDQVGIYRLISFPDVWEEKYVLLKNIRCVDSTFLDYENEIYLFTYKLASGNENKGRLMMYKLDTTTMRPYDEVMISDDKTTARPGGKFIHEKGKLIRVSQNSTKGYGEGLIFSQIESLSPFSEIIIKKMYVDDFIDNTKKIYTGVHTYNKFDDLEVIDLKFSAKSLSEHIARKRVRKVFVDRYPIKER